MTDPRLDRSEKTLQRIYDLLLGLKECCMVPVRLVEIVMVLVIAAVAQGKSSELSERCSSWK